MKNAMKKLMSLVLVAMILVSAVPFAASAAAGDPIHVTVYQKQADGSDATAAYEYATADEKVNVADICAAYGVSAEDFEGAWCTPAGGDKEYKKGYGDTAPAGSTLKIRKAAVQAVVEEEPVEDEPVVVEPPVVQEPIVEEAPVVDQPAAAAVEAIKIVVKVGSSDNVVWTGEKEPANGEYATVENLLNYCWNSSWSGAYTYDHGWSTKQQSNVGLTAKIYAGDTLSVMLQEKKAASNAADKDDDNTINVNTGSTSNQATGYTKFAYPVYLNIYTDTTVGTAKKTINITSGIAADGRLTLNEVKSLVFNYYKANTSAGIQFDGLYPAQGNWVYDYAVDQKYDTIEGLYDAAANNYVYINVMITNATAISSSNADTSNPKTGDEIYMAVTGMAVTASALALCMFFAKKRAV